MRWIVVLSLITLIATDAGAQRRGGGIGFRRGPSGFGFDRGASVLPYGLGYGWPSFGDAFLPPDGLLPNGAAPPYGYPQPPIVVIQQPPAAPVIEEPPREVHPVIVEFHPPDASPAEGQAQPFGIVMKDGSIRSAKAVVVVASDYALIYVDPEERHVRIPMSDVDREATRNLNRERKKVTLWLPAPPEPAGAPATNR